MSAKDWRYPLWGRWSGCGCCPKAVKLEAALREMLEKPHVPRHQSPMMSRQAHFIQENGLRSENFIITGDRRHFIPKKPGRG